MTTLDVPLTQVVTTILDSTGGGSVQLGPHYPGRQWQVSTVTVTTSTNAQIPTCRIFLGAVNAVFLGGTENGSRDSMGPDCILTQGQILTAVWMNGDVGAVATMTLYGTEKRGAW